MSVYRGDKPENTKPDPKPDSPPQPTIRQPDSELTSLNEHRQHHGHEPLKNPQLGDDLLKVDNQTTKKQNRPALDNHFYQKGGVNGNSSGGYRLGQQVAKAVQNSVGKKAALAASGFLAPIIIAITILVLAFNAGLQTEQVAQVLTGVRFSRLYGQMTKRLSHIKETYVLHELSPDENSKTEDLNRRRGHRRSLVGWLTGTNDKKIYRDLTKKGYRFEFEDKLALGRSRAVALFDQNGNKVLDFSRDSSQSSGRQLREFEAKLRTQPGYGNGLWGRFKARRTVRLIAYQAGIKFVRFRKAMDSIRQARDWVRNKIRGPPEIESVSHAVSDDIITQKSRVKRWGSLRNGIKLGILFNISNEDIDSAGRGWAQETQKGWANRARNWVDEKGRGLSRNKIVQKWNSQGKLTKLAGFVRGASALMFLMTAFCTIKVLVDMVRDLAGTKINQQMDTAASLFTVASQMRAGDMEQALASNWDGRLEGFADTATYQILHEGNNRPSKDQVENTIKYINHHFNIKKSFGTMFFVMNKFIQTTIQLINAAINAIPQSHLYDLTADGLNWALSFIPGFSNPIPNTREIATWILGSCSEFLKTSVQISLGILFALIEIGLAIVTGGTWGAISAAVNGIIKAIVFSIAVSATAQALSLDEAAMQYLMPEAVAIMSGVDSALAENQNEGDLPSDGLIGPGRENYLKLDYGAWHLSQAQALAEGGGLIDKNTAVAQDKIYLAQYKQSYTKQGVWDNIANPHNPYSMIAKLKSRLPSNAWQTQPSQIKSTIGWLAATPTSLVESAIADEELDEIRGYLLYPDQGRSISDEGEIIELGSENDLVVGFTDEEINGEGDFNFMTNSFYVEENFDDLKNKYSKCLAISLPEFRLYQADIKKSNGEDFYPSECMDHSARRYSIYYHDCLHLNDIESYGGNNSPMFSSFCDEMLPDGLVDDLDASDDRLKSASTSSIWQEFSHSTNQIIVKQKPTELGGFNKLTPNHLALIPQTPLGAKLWLTI